MNVHLRRWGRRGLTVIAAALGCVNLLGAVAYLSNSGWSNERTILYAAEGGVMSPREALMDTVLFLAGTVIWFLVFAGTAAPANSRARLVSRSAMMGTLVVGVLALGGGELCGDPTGHLVVAAMVGLPIVLVAAAVRRWGMQAASPP